MHPMNEAILERVGKSSNWKKVAKFIRSDDPCHVALEVWLMDNVDFEKKFLRDFLVVVAKSDVEVYKGETIDTLNKFDDVSYWNGELTTWPTHIIFRLYKDNKITVRNANHLLKLTNEVYPA